MAVTCEDFIIDIAHEQSFKYLQAKQYDHNSRRRRLIITDSNVPIKYSDARSEYITLSLYINGKNYSNTSCPFEADGYPYITFTESMLSQVGDVSCEIRIYDHIEGTIITTFTFMMTVSKSLLNHDRLIASSEFNILNDLILQALSIRELITEYEKNKEIIDAFILQINNDIDNYKNNFNNLSNETQGLIADVRNFLNTSQAAENNRIQAENARILAEEQRQKEMTDKINEIELRTQNAIIESETKVNSAINNITTLVDAKLKDFEQYIADVLVNIEQKAMNYIDQYMANLRKAIITNSQDIANIYDLIELLHPDVRGGDINGGNADTDESLYINDYDGGTALDNNLDYEAELDNGSA